MFKKHFNNNILFCWMQDDISLTSVGTDLDYWQISTQCYPFTYRGNQHIVADSYLALNN